MSNDLTSTTVVPLVPTVSTARSTSQKHANSKNENATVTSAKVDKTTKSSPITTVQMSGNSSLNTNGTLNNNSNKSKIDFSLLLTLLCFGVLF
jgi:hypothetical protein